MDLLQNRQLAPPHHRSHLDITNGHDLVRELLSPKGWQNVKMGTEKQNETR